MENKAQNKKQMLISIAQILGVLAISVLIVVYRSNITEFFGRFSYVGIFLISLIAHATVLFPTAPFQLAMVSMASKLDPIAFGIFAGVGSAIGEITGYAVGMGSQNILRTKNKLAKYIIKLQKGVMRYHPKVAIFILSAIPNPFFDLAGILAGIAKMKWQDFLFWCAVGRVVRYVTIAYFGLWAMGVV